MKLTVNKSEFIAMPPLARMLVAICLCLFLQCAMNTTATAAEERDYVVTDPALKIVPLDSSPNESFLSMRADTRGRLFVGGREALFVYEPDDVGGYKPRRELYRFPPHSWVYDIEIRGADIYALTLNALYIIPGGAVRYENLKAKRLIWGVPQGHVHQCFHGLAWGPAGDLYISMGDPLWYYGDFNRPDHWGHWTFFCQPAGTKVPYTGVGGVFRCRPDGSNFRVVARGLRNSCGLCFDRDWNLFTNDNDHEGLPRDYVPGRLNHVTPHSDFSWPRGWMLSKTPDRADMLSTMFDGMGRAVPVGQTYYDEDFFPAKYRNNLFVARWGSRAVTRYPLEHKGATFSTKEFTLLEGRNQARPVGVAVGRGGRVFVTIAYMPHNEGSPTYKSDLIMITRADDPAAHPFEPYNVLTAKPNKLGDELSHRSWWRRQRAHVELLRRGGPAVIGNLTGPLADENDLKAETHMLWLAAAWHRGTTGETSRDVVAELTRLGRHKNAMIRLQAIRALGDEFANEPASRSLLMKALQDKNPQVRHAAVVGLFHVAKPGDAFQQIADGPARSKDTYIRQAAVLLLAETASLQQIGELCAATDPVTRLAGVLAAGFRLTMPPATSTIPKHLPLTPWRSEEVYHVQYADEKVDLREYGRIGLFTVAEHWNAGKRTAEQEALFVLLRKRLGDANEPVRLQAVHFLSLLGDARTEPQIAKVRIATARQRLQTAGTASVTEMWAAGPFPDDKRGFKTVHPPEAAAVDLAADYKTSKGTIAWKKMKRGVRMFDFHKEYGNVDDASCYAYCRLESPLKQQIMLLVGSDDGVKVWCNGRVVHNNEVVRGALPYQDVVYVELQQGSNDLLVRVQNIAGECALYLHYRALDRVTVTLPEKIDVAGLADRLKAAAATGTGAAKVPPEFLKIDWTQAARTGDAERGRKLFSADGIGCAKCHAVRPDEAVTGGPSLTGAARRFTPTYLVESILLPSKAVSPVFRATLIVATSGKTYTGLVITETADRLELLQADAKKITFAKTDIETRKLQNLSPMPPGLLKQPNELRDLLAFLLQRTAPALKP
jgi:putative heme-binding domain-containing protein